MPQHDTHHENLVVWPPAVACSPLILQAHPSSRSVRMGRNALWCAVTGFILWAVTVAVMLLINKFSPSLESLKSAVFDKIIHTVYFAGLFCEAAGIYFSLHGRSARIGKVGLAVSVVLLGSMISLTLIDHYQSGSGQWLWNETLNDDCGCDGSG